MDLQHVLITRFCYRGGRETEVGGIQRSYDPLEPRNLEHRFRMLEIASLPSVLSQTEQDFTWILLVDRDLDETSRDRMRTLFDGRPRTFLHEFDPKVDLFDSAWILPYLEPFEDGEDYLVTTNLDDDDALPRTFIAALQAATREMAAKGPPLLILGAAKPLQWDLVLTDDAPLGLTSPWHRADVFDTHVTAPGFTLAARQPQYPFTVVTRIHGWAKRYLDFAVPADNDEVAFARERFQAAARAAGDDLARYPGADTFRDVGPVAGPVLVTNHALNLQKTRLLERKPGQVPVVGRETFAAFELGWSVVERHADYFRGTRGFFWRRDLWRRTLPIRRFFRGVRRRSRRIAAERLAALRR